MIREDLDRRMLAAVRFRDATVGTVVAAPLRIIGDRVRIVRNLSGFHVLTEAPGYEAYAAAFRDPPAVGPDAIELSVVDPAGRYLPRTVSVGLPRDINPPSIHAGDSIWRPLEVQLFPSPTAIAGVGWASLRLSIKRPGSDDGLPFAYVRVMAAGADPGDDPLAVGLADHRGEAYVPVAGVPATSWSTEATTSPIINELAVKVTAYFDADAYDERAGRYPDPDALEDTFSTLPHSVAVDFDLRSGRAEARRIDVPLP